MRAVVMRAVILSMAVLASPALAQENITFDFAHTTDCIEQAETWEAQLACIGTAAVACMDESAASYSTLGQRLCFNAEWQEWDAWLNRLYPQLLEKTARMDQQSFSGFQKPSEALRNMQRAWIPYRDASCDFEASIWGEGSGAAPAKLGCLMVETGEQVLRLNGFLDMP